MSSFSSPSFLLFPYFSFSVLFIFLSSCNIYHIITFFSLPTFIPDSVSSFSSPSFLPFPYFFPSFFLCFLYPLSSCIVVIVDETFISTSLQIAFLKLSSRKSGFPRLTVSSLSSFLFLFLVLSLSGTSCLHYHSFCFHLFCFHSPEAFVYIYIFFSLMLSACHC